MHLKKIPKYNFLQHHSIPILLNKTRSRHLRYVSYSIPLMCSLALLLLLSNLFIIDDVNKTYAEEDDNISTYATTSVNPTATLTIENSHLDTIASPGTVNYVSSKVDVSASDITGYSLILSGPESLSGSTSITGAGGKNPNDMSNNSWGYAWTPVISDKDGSTNDTYIYNTLSPNGSNIKDNSTDTKISNFSVSFSRQLTFAAKFAEDAESGHYKANVTLSLAATPREVATGFNGIYDMQDMTTNICRTAQKGIIGSLEDTRDGNVYTVAKLDDDNCWMTRNLSLALWDEENNTPVTLTPEDSNVKENWVSTTGKSERWKAPDANCTSENMSVCTGITKYYNGSETVNWKSEYGYYYTWGTTTVGEASSIVSPYTDVTQDICPKGWELPSSSTYIYMLNRGNIPRDTEGASKLLASPYNFVFSGTLSSSSVVNISDFGEYWTSTSGSNSGAAQVFVPTAKAWSTNATYSRARGRTIRCIAKDDDTRTLNDITTMQEMTPKICENTPQYTINQKVYKLSDVRDGNEYNVTKLEDGRCWMTENISLLGEYTLTPADSDVSEIWTLPSSLTPSEITAEDFAIQDGNPYKIRSAYNPDTVDQYGAYYSWCAATANTCNISSGDAISSICPKGWKLPSRLEYKALLATIIATEEHSLLAQMTEPPYNFPLSGYVLESGKINPGSIRNWSSTAGSTTAYNLGSNSSTGDVQIDISASRARGFSVRCIAY